MNIISVDWVNQEHTHLRVVLDQNGGSAPGTYFVPVPADAKYKRLIDKWVDDGGVIGDPPPPAVYDPLDIDEVQTQLKALGLVVAQWAGKTPAQLKTAFRAAMEQLNA